MATPIIVVDPFFDGNSNQRAVRRYGSHTADQETFATHDLHGNPVHSMMAGRPISSVLPNATGGRGRLSNMVVSPASPGGVPTGFSPNMISDIVVEIDPQIQGNSVRLALGQLHKTMVQTAFDEVTGVLPPDGTVERQRLRGAATYHALASQLSGAQAPITPNADDASKTAMAPKPPPRVQMDVHHGVSERIQIPNSASFTSPQPTLHQPTIQAQPMPQQPIQAASWGAASPLAALRAPIAPAAVQMAMPQQAPRANNHPTRRVHFEFELQSANGAYSMHQDASYHDVLHIPGFIILIWDKSYEGQQYSPPDGESAPPTAVMVEGDPQAYLVATTPIRYDHRGFAHTVLLVQQAVPLP